MIVVLNHEGMAIAVAASRAAPTYTSKVMLPVAAVAPSAWVDIPAATVILAVVQVQTTQSARSASIGNDNLQLWTHMHGDVIVNSSVSSANDPIGDIKTSLGGQAYAINADSGQASSRITMWPQTGALSLTP